MEDWQFVQMVDAVENLLRTARAPVAAEVDWAFWRDSAGGLGRDNPTVAREAVPAATLEAPVSGARFKDKRNARSALDALRGAHAPVLERMPAEIRRRKPA